MKKKVNWWMIVIAILVVIIVAYIVYSYSTKGVLFSPSAPTSSYYCYKSNGTVVTCLAGQYCITGSCSNSAPPSYVNSYGCYSSTGVLQNCNNSQLCYNGACVDSVAATGYYTKAEINGKFDTLYASMWPSTAKSLNENCAVWSVAVPNVSRQVNGDEICKERGAGTCIFTIFSENLNHAILGTGGVSGPSLGFIDRCTGAMKGPSDQTVAYCCLP